ncbi:MAG TPA: YncE family protein [Geminicoccaceae bacterium]|nr:YncE family protein [Geminicoccaceae bacterium]
MADRDAILLVHKNDHSLGYYDPDSGAEIGRVAVAPFPHGLAVTPDGARAYATQFGLALADDEGPGGSTVSVIDVALRRRVGALDCGPYRRPHGVALDRAGRLYVLSEAAGVLLVADDPESGGGFGPARPTGGEGSHMVSVTGDGRLAFASNMFSNTVTALDPRDPERPPVALPSGRRPEGSVLDADEARCFVACRGSGMIVAIDVAGLDLLEPIRTRPGPVRLCWDDRGRLLAACYEGRGVAVLDPADPEAQRFVPLPHSPVSIGFDPRRRRAMASTVGDRLCLIDPDRAELVGTIPTRPGPDPMAMVALKATA